MAYIDGFVIPVPTDRKDDYIAHAKLAAPVFERLGATQIVECWGDNIPDGTTTDFRSAVKAEPGETVVFSWIVYPSKAVRDAANAAMMTDPGMAALPPMPFDGKRMIFGGFVPVLDTHGAL